MAVKQHIPWYFKAENGWLLIAVLLGIIYLLLSILLWNASGKTRDVNSLSVSLTILEIFLAVITSAGFVPIRNSAIRAADEQARDEANRIAPAMARRAATE